MQRIIATLSVLVLVGAGCADKRTQEVFSKRVECSKVFNEYKESVSSRNIGRMKMGFSVPQMFVSVLETFYSAKLDTCVVYIDESNTGSQIRNHNQRFLKDALTDETIFQSDPFYYDEHCDEIEKIVRKEVTVDEAAYQKCEREKIIYFGPIELRKNSLKGE